MGNNDPVKGHQARAFHNGFNLISVVNGSVETEGLSTWDDGASTNLFDKADGFFNTYAEETKIGGNTNASIVTIKFKINKAKIVAYAFITGNDSATWTGRTPTSWVLYGSNDGKKWEEVDRVTDAGTEDLNREYFGYNVDYNKQKTYTYLKFEFTRTTGSVFEQFQLNECYLYTY